MDQDLTVYLRSCPRCKGDVIRVNERMRTEEEIKGKPYSGYVVHCCSCTLRGEEGNINEAISNWNNGILKVGNSSVSLH